MYNKHTNSRGAPVKTPTKEIRILNAISRVSSRLANNLAILAEEQPNEKGGQSHVKNVRN